MLVASSDPVLLEGGERVLTPSHLHASRGHYQAFVDRLTGSLGNFCSDWLPQAPLLSPWPSSQLASTFAPRQPPEQAQGAKAWIGPWGQEHHPQNPSIPRATVRTASPTGQGLTAVTQHPRNLGFCCPKAPKLVCSGPWPGCWVQLPGRARGREQRGRVRPISRPLSPAPH